MPNTIPGASKSPDVLCSCVQMPLLSGRSQLIIPEGRLRGQHVMFGQGLSVQFSSVSQSCPILCDPMDSTPGLPVHHQLPELTQTHFH